MEYLTDSDNTGTGDMELKTFQGFGGLELQAEILGSADDPSVLLLHSAGQTRAIWRDVAEALARAGRHVIALDLRGHGDSAKPADRRYDFAAYVEDLRCVLSQLSSRPVVIASTSCGGVATAALSEEGAHLSTGLVLADVPSAPGDDEACDPACAGGFEAEDMQARIKAAAASISVPALVVRDSQVDRPSIDIGPDLFPQCDLIELSGPANASPDAYVDDLNAALIDFLERRAPRFAPEYRQGSDARTLRDALGCFATGVTVVTALDSEGQPLGLTANSFTSVSLDPPLLLVCIANSARSLEALKSSANFAVNVLHIGQQHTSNLFARPGVDRFAQVDWSEGDNGAPLLDGALVNFECSRHEIHAGGDHIILVGKVDRARFEPRKDPLLYFRGKYRRLHFA